MSELFSTEKPQPCLLASDILDKYQHIYDQMAVFAIDTDNASIAARIMRHAAHTPDAIAVSDSHASRQHSSMTYQQLVTLAIHVAYHLSTLGVSRGDVVVTRLERHSDAVAVMLGVWLAGAAYVPIDPTSPRTRQQLILQDVFQGTQGVLITDSVTSDTPLSTSSQHDANQASTQPHVLTFDALMSAYASDDAALLHYLKDNIQQADDVAYVIYTSGSTGIPKGVLVESQQFSALMDACQQHFHFNAQHTWSCFHSFGFDFSVWELWGALSTGGHVVVVDYATTRDPQAFYRLLFEKSINVLNQTPSAFYSLIDIHKNNHECELNTLRYVIFGGEALDAQRLAPWIARQPLATTALINMFGITETTVHVTYKCLSEADILSCHSSEAHNGSNIGQVLAHLEYQIIDDELYIAGAGVSRGYLRRDSLNAQRFVTLDDKRFYRTGDKVQRLPNGDLCYLGRLDDQVSLHGYRIELGEIEAALRQCDALQAACVQVLTEQKQLAAWLLLDPAWLPEATQTQASPLSNEAISTQIEAISTQIRETLQRALPRYMHPNQFFILDAFPLTDNGKVDKKQLITLQQTPLVANAHALTPPQTPRQQQIAAIWCAVLDKPHVGIHDDFFACGGDSIRSIFIANRLAEQGIDFPAHQLFYHPSVAQMAQYIDEHHLHPEDQPQAQAQNTQKPVTQKQPPLNDALLPLTATQEGIYFHSVNSDRRDMYVEQLSFVIHKPLDADGFKCAWEATIAEFPILRTRFVTDTESAQVAKHQVCQEIVPIDTALTHFQWQETDLSHVDSTQAHHASRQLMLDAAQQGFDIAQAGLFRVNLVQLASSKGRYQQFIWTWHHLILDGWSLSLVLERVFAHYQAWQADHAALSDTKIHAIARDAHQGFSRYVHWLEGQHTDDAFWRQHYAARPPQAELGIMRSSGLSKPQYENKCEHTPAPSSKPIAYVSQTETREYVLASDAFARLNYSAKQLAVPVNSLISAMWALVSSQYHQTLSPTFGMTLSGRGALHHAHITTSASTSDLAPNVQSDTQTHNIQHAVGVLINTLPVGIDIDMHSSVQQLVEGTFAHLRDVMQHEHDALADITQVIKNARDAYRAQTAHCDINSTSNEATHNVSGSLFDTLLVFENYLEKPLKTRVETHTGNTSTEAHSHDPVYLLNTDIAAEYHISDVQLKEDTNYPLTVTLFPQDTLLIRAMSNRALLASAHVDAMMQQFVRLLTQVSTYLERSVLDLMAATLTWQPEPPQAHAVPVNTHSSIEHLLSTPQHVQRLEAALAIQAQKTPNAIALYEANQHEQQHDGGKSLTYQQLENAANQLANYLLKLGIGVGKRVALYLPRRADLIVSLYAILKSGASYVPLDLDYPSERVQFIVEDAQCDAILALSEHPVSLDIGNTQIWYIDQHRELIDAQAIHLPAAHCDSLSTEAIAYTIYTSGSTGQPKGVQIAHHNLANLMAWSLATYTREADTTAVYSIDSDHSIDSEHFSCVLASTSICFDLSVFEIFMPMLAGGSICLVDNALQLIYLQQLPAISLINSVPSLTRELVKHQAIPDSVRVINLAGEPLPRKLVNQLYALPHVEHVYNLYGPSEDSTYSTAERVTRATDAPVHIGRPLPHTQAWVLTALDTHVSDTNSLDTNNSPVCFMPSAPGCEGELILSGAGVAQGYLHREALTAERFVRLEQLLPDAYFDALQRQHCHEITPDAIQALRQTRAYKTGDRVRWSADGKLDYLGRQDHQIKFRGVRIELQEIQSVAEQQAHVHSALIRIVNDRDNTAHLVAYLHVDAAFEVDDFTQQLRQRLPVSMLPTDTFPLNELPLTPNKKIDVTRLPIPDALSELRQSSRSPESTTPAHNTEWLQAPVAHTLHQFWVDILDVDAGQLTPDSDFFALGGHSLLATKLMLAIKAEWQLSFRLSHILHMPTLAAQIAHIDAALCPPETALDSSELASDDAPSEAELLNELSALSEDELEQLLNMADE